MCQYCGCRDIPLLRDYIAEHERVINHGGAAISAFDAGDYPRARTELAAMAAELRSHWLGEETGLFAVMGRDEMFREHITPLIAEHRELGALLDTVDVTRAEDRDRVRVAFDELYEHIAKEEDGLFPAALTNLDGDEWDTAIAAWHRAHPGRSMIAEGQ
ncbi:hemerythrin [Mycolicibacterium chitae]|uniref:Hemerythrin HHE cation binding domain-containing protein n=1 Tax=Mycolicibacterium chitae TaxID=1792 RepID=A0A448I7K0_MYCCI|nr:hemerythrin domain-containing protein [Mycolicibacterium chitae]MCV7109214.1 hemerythrin domain-containing protein [Mycolicibacterium chitae]BBZ04832.1 hemerythrin [Mycolicibacterium chitae]VEG48458.1 hemerythrin HHE cation binding domain-containing protein [Mycolicibacterium chitae]